MLCLRAHPSADPSVASFLCWFSGFNLIQLGLNAGVKLSEQRWNPDSLHTECLNTGFSLVESPITNSRSESLWFDVSDLVCGNLLLCDPAHGVLEVPSRIIPGRPAAPPGAPPPVETACEGLMDPLQLVLTHLHPAHTQTGSGSIIRIR